MSLTNNYLARIDDLVWARLGHADVIGVVFDAGGSTFRAGYWERRYLVAWESKDQAGTHVICINSDGEEMAIGGQYFVGHRTPEERRHLALENLVRRSYMYRAIPEGQEV